MTLLELLLTMVLLGLLMGVGVGMFSALDFGRRSALALVQNVVRSARNAAVARAAPARVRIDAASGTLAAAALDVAGTWRFEGETLVGAFGIDGRLAGAELGAEGYLGNALRLVSNGSYAELDVQDDPGFDLRDGFTIDCALRLDSLQSGGVLDVGGAAGLAVAGSGAMRAWLTPEVQATGGTARSGGRILIESLPGALSAGRWQRMRFEYDRRIARVLVDGVEVARTEETAPVWRIEGPLRLGDPRGAMLGRIDDLVVAVVAESEAAVLPPSVHLGPDAPAEVRFDARGHLDREVHAGPLSFQLAFDDGASQIVHIGMYGTVY